MQKPSSSILIYLKCHLKKTLNKFIPPNLYVFEASFPCIYFCKFFTFYPEDGLQVESIWENSVS